MIVTLLQFCIRLYRGARLFPSPCRHYPSCSVYADQALAKHGAVKGSYLALKRLIRCNQFFPGGVDVVPENV